MARIVRGVLAGVLIAAAGPAIAPASAQTQQHIDWCENEADRYDLIIRGCTAVIQSGRWPGKNLAMAFILRGNAYGGKNDLDRAIADYSQAIRHDPKEGKAFWLRAITYQAKKDPARAALDFAELAQIHPTDAVFWVLACDARAQAGQWQQAEARFI
jgi:tetratricopeptide (TPR) repeat protein